MAQPHLNNTGNCSTVGLYEDSIRRAASIIDVIVREIKDITLNR